MKRRRFLSLIVAMLMVMSSCLPVLAASPTNGLSYDDMTGIVSSTATVTITGIPDEVEISGSQTITFSTYKILDAVYDESTNTISYALTDWAYVALVTSNAYTSESAAIEAILKSINYTTTSGTPTATDGTSKTEQTTVLNTLAAYVATNGVSQYAFSQTGESNWNYDTTYGTASATLAVGAYLVVPLADNMTFLNTMVSVNAESAGNTSNEWTTSAVGAVLKGTPVSLTKVVKEEDDPAYAAYTDAEIGETVTYQLTVTVPTFDVDVTGVVFKVVDLPENVKIDTSSIKVVGTKTNGDTTTFVDSTVASPASGEVTAFTMNYTYDTTATPPNVLTIDFSDYYKSVFCVGGTYPYTTITITYDAEVMSTATPLSSDPNENTATVTYDHGGITEITQVAQAQVYTYEATVLKTDTESTPNLLYGAEFEIYTDDSLSNKLNFILNSDGTYSVADSSYSSYATLTTGTDGKITIIGLDADTTYYIKETSAPSGYTINANVLEFKISGPQGDVSTVSTTEHVGSPALSPSPAVTPEAGSEVWGHTVSSSVLSLSLKDTTLASIPSTGGVGIIIFTVLGVCLMIVAVFLLNSKDSKKKQAQ